MTPWIPTIPLFKPSPRSPNNCHQPSLLISDLFHHETLKWNTVMLQALFEKDSVREISKIHVSKDPNIKYIWTPSCSGRCSTSSAYLSAISSRYSTNAILASSNFWKSIWKLNLNDRLRLFLWKIAWNILPTKERLNSIFPSNLEACPLCKVLEDSLQHLFFNCSFARIIWRSSSWPLDSTALNFSNMRDWINLILYPGAMLGIPIEDHHRFQIFASVACDILWSSRNKAYHDGTTFDDLQVSRNVNKLTLEHFEAWHKSSISLVEKWIPPPPGWFKINYDTAIQDSFSVQAAVCCNNSGNIIRMTSQISSKCLPNIGEAMAVLLAVPLASSSNIKKFILEGDSLVVILALLNPNFSQDWRISPIILKTLDSIPASSSWRARKVNRSANFCAHSVTHWAATRFSSGSIPITPPTPSIRIVSGKDPSSLVLVC
ncbi:uncharacterized protein LOC132167148 [Corylus avellana]|uniref:uncharacterized protein LOC132167148 n=1 Tax=Corylus avellana TaxID=13451 RepID=UPI00286CD9F8|nr:uncharacterized protein LOC132167148 [Corylus avellana]